MPIPKPLSSPEAARRTLAHRLTPTADRLRQLNTRFGLRSKRVWLVWTRWTGEVRGEGEEQLLARVELLPTPRISDLGSLTRRPYLAGVFREGTVRVDQISAGAYTYDVLRGLSIPGPNSMAPRADQGAAVRGLGAERTTDPRVDFWYEVVEDGRGEDLPLRLRFRVLGGPSRAEGSLYWALTLELADEASNRTGAVNQIGVSEIDRLLGGA